MGELITNLKINKIMQTIGKIMQKLMIGFCLLVALLFTISTLIGNCPIWCWLLLTPISLLGAWVAKVEEW